MTDSKRTLAILIAAGLALTLGIACGGGGGGGNGGGDGSSGGAVSENTWVGQLTDSDAYIAIMKEGQAHLVYITDGKEIALWFKGNVGVAGAGYFQFQDAELRAVNAQPQGRNYRGTVTVAPGQHVTFVAVPAKEPAGLYRAKDGDEMSGWIQLEDGSFRGAKLSSSGGVEGLSSLGGTKWTDPAREP